MFREIRRSERITDADRKKNERDRLIERMIDYRVESEEYLKAKAALDEFDRHNKVVASTFNPDARV